MSTLVSEMVHGLDGVLQERCNPRSADAVYRIGLHQPLRLAEVRTRLAQYSARVEPNLIYTLEGDTKDEFFPDQWSLENTGQEIGSEHGKKDVDINAEEAWEYVKATVIDSGVAYRHCDLGDNIWVNDDDPIDGVDNDGDGYIDDRHGIDAAAAGTSPGPTYPAGDPTAFLLTALCTPSAPTRT